jgi:hypothetical protein
LNAKKLIIEALKDQQEIFGDDLFEQLKFEPEKPVYKSDEPEEKIISEKNF